MIHLYYADLESRMKEKSYRKEIIFNWLDIFLAECIRVCTNANHSTDGVFLHTYLCFIEFPRSLRGICGDQRGTERVSREKRGKKTENRSNVFLLSPDKGECWQNMHQNWLNVLHIVFIFHVWHFRVQTDFYSNFLFSGLISSLTELLSSY